MTTSSISPTLLEDIRRICLEFPEAVEKETWGHPTFRVRDKIFVGAGVDDDTPDGEANLTMKAPEGEQEILLATDGPFFYPRYVGVRGWIGVHLNGATDWSEIAELVEESYRLTAPKKLVALLD